MTKILAILVFLVIGVAQADSYLAARNLRASTVHMSVGTGFVVQGASGKLYLLTNWHVCVGTTWKGRIFGSYPSGKMVRGDVSKMSPKYDLCAAKLTEQAPALRIAPKLSVGDDIYTRGYPEHILSESHGTVAADTTWTTIFGIAEVGTCPEGATELKSPFGILEGCELSFKSTLTSLYSRPGSSGSPVVNEDGELVGVISSWHPRTNYEAGMVRHKDLKAFLEDL